LEILLYFKGNLICQLSHIDLVLGIYCTVQNNIDQWL